MTLGLLFTPSCTLLFKIRVSNFFSYLAQVFLYRLDCNFLIENNTDRIRSIPPELFDEDYRYISFDVTSLFTNVPLNRTIKIILKRVYEEKLVKTNLKKNTLKKLIKDSCSKTAFMFNGKIYKQIDGVSMASSLGPVLANVIMTEFDKIVFDKLIKDGIIKLYIRYVDDTLVLAK